MEAILRTYQITPVSYFRFGVFADGIIGEDVADMEWVVEHSAMDAKDLRWDHLIGSHLAYVIIPPFW